MSTLTELLSPPPNVDDASSAPLEILSNNDGHLAVVYEMLKDLWDGGGTKEKRR